MEKYRHKVMYYETDKMGVTHHSNYIRFMEEARVDFLEKIGWPYEKLEALGIVSPVTAVSCRFKTPSTFADILEIDVYIKEYKGARLYIGYEMKNQSGGTVAIGESEHCFLGQDGRPLRLSRACPEFDAALKEWETHGTGASE